MKYKLIIGGMLVLALTFLGLYAAQAETEKMPLFGSSEIKTFYWHSDTNASGDEIVHADDYHWDTVASYGFTRSDNKTNEPIFVNLVGSDGFKLFLGGTATTAGCSLLVTLKMGKKADTLFATGGTSSEGAFKAIFDYTEGFTDSVQYLEDLEVQVIVGDTITNDTAEFDRPFSIYGSLYLQK